MTASFRPDPKLDLVFERVVDVPPHLVWRAWTERDLILKWFTPAPWQTVDCEIDLRPGGIFRSVMRSPEGQDFDNGPGCYLEVVENRKLVWTNAMTPGFRPVPYNPNPGPMDFLFTAMILLEPHGAAGTKYTAIAIHQDEAGRKTHESMGFEEGWGKALDQLVALVKTL
jgi:uncharacterized protein YndB with AHSA1/START domain